MLQEYRRTVRNRWVDVYASFIFIAADVYIMPTRVGVILRLGEESSGAAACEYPAGFAATLLMNVWL
jgi:hypothetical protein